MFDLRQLELISKNFEEWQPFLYDNRWWFRVEDNVRGSWPSYNSAKYVAEAQQNTSMLTSNSD